MSDTRAFRTIPAAPEDQPAFLRVDGAARLQELLATAKPADLSRFMDELGSAGVRADRWTSPDLTGQLVQCLKRPIDTVVCNALDFDDALALQENVLRDFALEVVTGVAVLGAITGATRVLIATAGHDAGAKAVERLARSTRARVVPVRNDYPQANPTLLLHTLVRRVLRPGHLPTEVGALVLDAVAAAAAGAFLLYGRHMTRTPLGIADMRRFRARKPHLLDVPIGMSVADVIREAGVPSGAFELRGSSPLRELRLQSDCVISAGGEVALYLVARQPQMNPNPCIRCGWCVSSCPVHIHPAGILQAAQSGDSAAAEDYGLSHCIDCGACSYVCPSNLPLLGGVRSLRAEG